VKSPRRILIVRLSHLGDVVHALPVFHALRAGYPEAELGWAVQPEFAGLLEGMPGLERVIRFERKGGARAWSAVHAELTGFGADWTIDAQGNTKSALIALASGASRRSGYHPAQWTERFGAQGLTDTAPRTAAASSRSEDAQPGAPGRARPPGFHAPTFHAMDRSLTLAGHVAPHVGLQGTRTDPALTDAEHAAGREALDSWIGPGALDGAIVHLSAPADVRAWPTQRVTELARALARNDTPTLVLSGPGETSAGLAVESALAGTAVRHRIGQRGLRELAGVFIAAAERRFRLVACDSGPLHLAAACGLAVIGLAGPQDHRRTGPWPVPDASGETPGRLHLDPTVQRASPHRIVSAHAAPPCAPCLARRCDHRDGPICMAGITPEQVLAEFVSRPEVLR